MDFRIAIVLIGLTFALLELRRHGSGGVPLRDRSQLAFDLVSTGAAGLLISPLVAVLASLALDALSPGSRDALVDLPVWAMVAILLVGDDLTQYLWHRASHSIGWLFNLHRAHHSAPYMSVSMMYRNNVFYYAFMPGLWIGGALVHLGFGPVYAVYMVVKLSVIAGAHSSVRWDEALYRVPALRPLMWVVERVISTPSTHSMHHGLHTDDGVTHYAGNYGNLLFLWDVLFGTAKITRRYPEAYGVEGLAPVSLATELAWPLVRSSAEGAHEGVAGEPGATPQERASSAVLVRAR